MKYGHKDNGTDDNDQDVIREFRRVQIIQRESSSPKVPVTSSDGTTRRCINNIFYIVYSDGEKEVTEQLDPCRPGHVCSEPIVRKYDLESASYSKPHLIDPKNTRNPGDTSSADSPIISVSTGWLALRTESSPIRSQSTPLSPGWTPLGEYVNPSPLNYDTNPAITPDPFATYVPPLPPPRFVPIDGPLSSDHGVFSRLQTECIK